MAASRPEKGSLLWVGLGILTPLLVITTLYLVFVRAPIEAEMRIVQKVFYFHVPSAYAMYVAFVTAAISSLLYLLKRKEKYDAWSVAGTEVGLVFFAIVLTTGPLWARKAWGVWWTWDPRLTTTLLAGLVFAASLALRSVGNAGEGERRFSSALAVLGIAILPVIHYSVKLWRGQHPTLSTLNPDMALARASGFATFTALVIFLLWARARAERIRQEARAIELECVARGITEEGRL